MDWKLVTLNQEGFNPHDSISSNPCPFSFCLSGIDLRAACRRELVEAWTSVRTGLWKKEAGCHTLGLITSPTPEQVWPLFVFLIYMVSPIPTPHYVSLSVLPVGPEWLAFQGLLSGDY